MIFNADFQLTIKVRRQSRCSQFAVKTLKIYTVSCDVHQRPDEMNSEQMSDPRGEREVKMSHYCLGTRMADLAQTGTSVGRVRTSARSVTQFSHTSSNPGCQKPIASQSQRGGLRGEEVGGVKLIAEEMKAGGKGHTGVRRFLGSLGSQRSHQDHRSSSRQQQRQVTYRNLSKSLHTKSNPKYQDG